MKKFLLSIFTIILLSSCSLFQKEEVIPTIQDIPNQIEEQTITEIPTPIDNIVENKIEITEKQKTRNLSIKEQILNIFKEKEEKLTLFPKNWTTETQTEIIPEGDWAAGNEIVTINIDLGGYQSQFQSNPGCGGNFYSQVITDNSGEKVDKLPYTDIPEKIKIGNVEYEYNSNNITFSEKAFRTYLYSEQNTKLDNISVKDATNISIDELISSFSGGIINSNYIPEIVNIKFDEFPIYFSYKKSSSIPISFSIIKLNPDDENSIGADGKVTSISLTDKLIKKYTAGISGRIEGFANSENRKYITEIEENAKLNANYLENGEINYTTEDGGKVYEKLVLEESDLPIIYLNKLDDNGYYSMSFVEPYEYVTYAEMCKPAIYVYTPISQNQSVEIKPINSLSYFTKTIPNFDTKNTWNYSTNPSDGNIIGTDKNIYPYLYYSIKVPNYEFNTDGWQVEGSDIKVFFEDKLDKIGFNEKEKSDFIEYWLELYNDENAYYFVSFKYNEEIDKYVKLNFNKTPNSQFRVLLESYKLPKSFENDYFKYENVGDKFDKYLIKTANRSKDFDVFEWGGVFYREEENKFVIY